MAYIEHERVFMEEDIDEDEVCESCGEDLVGGVCQNPNCEMSGFAEGEKEGDSDESEVDEYELE